MRGRARPSNKNREARLFVRRREEDKMHTLRIGDRTSDDSLIIHDEDRLCYQVRWFARGTYSIRTISKALLNEWVRAYADTPDAKSQDVRERIVGQSDIDRFEYGYAATLAVMAKMILGKMPIIRKKS